MSQDNIYTFQELKDYTSDFTNLDLKHLSRFIEDKTNNSSIFVTKRELIALVQQLYSNNISITAFQESINESWKYLTKNNQETLDYWKTKVKELSFILNEEVYHD